MVRSRRDCTVPRANCVSGMNDVLPKPFTKEGLLNMLEKHLGHLKKLPESIEMVPSSASAMTNSTSGHSVKDEASPDVSTSTLSNWHSPGQFPGISPTTNGHFMQTVQTVHTPTTFNMDQGSMQFQHHPTPLSAPPRMTSHRRAISDITGGEDVSDAKRARIFAQTNAAWNSVRRAQPG